MGVVDDITRLIIAHNGTLPKEQNSRLIKLLDNLLTNTFQQYRLMGASCLPSSHFMAYSTLITLANVHYLTVLNMV